MVTAQVVGVVPPAVSVNVSVPVVVTTTLVPQVFALIVKGWPDPEPQPVWTALTVRTLDSVLVTAYGLLPENVAGVMPVSDTTESEFKGTSGMSPEAVTDPEVAIICSFAGIVTPL